MGKAEEILNKFSKKTIIWLFLSACVVLPSGGVFWYKAKQFIEETQQLRSDIIALKYSKDSINVELNNLRNTLISDETNNSNTHYVLNSKIDKNTNFLAENLEGSRKEFALKVLEMQKDQVVVKMLPDEIPINPPSIPKPPDTVKQVIVITKYIPDTVKKQGILKKALNVINIFK